MLKIRLRRMGSRHRPFYRVVVSDGRRVPTSSALDEIGYYDPRKQPSILELDLARVDHWLTRGAQPSETVGRLIAKVRKGKIDTPAHAPAAAEQPAVDEARDDEQTAAGAAEETEDQVAEAQAAAAGEEQSGGDAEATAEPAAGVEDTKGA